MARHIRIPVLGRALSPLGSEFVSIEALGGPVLLAATIAGFVWANVATGSYGDVWARHVTVGPFDQDLHHWINDGLMTVFFFVVGMEIKRELVRGDLRDRRTATLPVFAAVGGMVVPACLFLAINAGTSARHGWAIPMATDIAFALVLLTVLGARISQGAKLFLLTLAIVDDIGAILVIAIFYSHGLEPGWLVGAGAVVLVIVASKRLQLGSALLYVVPAVALWICVYESGVHATIAGVVLGLLTPVDGREVLDRLLRRLHPLSSLLVIPLFALANAGVHIDSATLNDAIRSRVAWGVIVGLVVGKPVGIAAAAAFTKWIGLGRLPDGMTWRDLFGVACIAGIGFTVSLFVADLSFRGAMLGDAKVGIVAASLLGATVGGLWFVVTARPGRR